MLAKATKEIPEGNYLYEPKWDGFRCIVFRDGDDVVLGSRNEKPLTRYFPELVAAFARLLPEPCLIDGEIVACPGDPRPGVTALQRDLNTLGYGPVTVDGQLGPQTMGALAALRAANGIAETGRADGGTLAAMKELLRHVNDTQCISDPGDYGRTLADMHAVMQVGPAVCEQYWWLVSFTVDEAFDDVLRRADPALYEGKEAGGGRLVIDTELPADGETPATAQAG